MKYKDGIVLIGEFLFYHLKPELAGDEVYAGVGRNGGPGNRRLREHQIPEGLVGLAFYKVSRNCVLRISVDEENTLSLPAEGVGERQRGGALGDASLGGGDGGDVHGLIVLRRVFGPKRRFRCRRKTLCPLIISGESISKTSRLSEKADSML